MDIARFKDRVLAWDTQCSWTLVGDHECNAMVWLSQHMAYLVARVGT